MKFIFDRLFFSKCGVVKELGSGEVVVYCVRGGSVSRSVQEKLRENNVKVKFIEGGLEAWKKSYSGRYK